MTNDGVTRNVTHFHFTGWPDFGTPRTPVGFIQLVQNVGRASEGDPILVHCSAGLGRSGVFVAVHSSLETQASGSGRVDMETVVREMRKQRGGMVQTSDQYCFCFEAIAEALDPILAPPATSEGFRPPEGTQKSEPSPPQVSDAPPLPPRPSRQRSHDHTCNVEVRRESVPSLSHSCSSDKAREREKRVSSPPPPSSSPPPPLTPPTSESSETTPTKFSFPETSPEATPTKSSTYKVPDILVTPPTRSSSMTVVNKDPEGSAVQGEKVNEREEGEKEISQSAPAPQSETTPPEKPRAVKPGDTSKEKKPEPAASLHQIPQRADKTTKPSSPSSSAAEADEKEPDITEEQLSESLTGFEVPPPGKDNTAEGFSIGDDQTLEAWLPPKMEVMKKAEEKPRWGGSVSLAKQRAQEAPKSSASSTKVRKWAPVLTSHSYTSKPEPVNWTGEGKEMRGKEQKVGKVVIPGVFSGNSSPTPVTTASPLMKPVRPEPKPVEQVWKPVSPETKLVEPVLKPVRPEPKPVEPVSEPAKRETTTPPVLRMIRKIEGGTGRGRGRSASPVTTPPTSLPISSSPAQQKPVKPVIQEPVKPVKQESPPPSPLSVRALKARFEKNA